MICRRPTAKCAPRYPDGPRGSAGISQNRRAAPVLKNRHRRRRTTLARREVRSQPAATMVVSKCELRARASATSTGRLSVRSGPQQPESASTSRCGISTAAPDPVRRYRLAPRRHCISTPTSIRGGFGWNLAVFSHCGRVPALARHVAGPHLGPHRRTATGYVPNRSCLRVRQINSSNSRPSGTFFARYWSVMAHSLRAHCAVAIFLRVPASGARGIAASQSPAVRFGDPGLVSCVRPGHRKAFPTTRVRRTNT